MEKKLFYRYESKSEDKNDFILQEKLLYGAHKNCFITKEEAANHFEAAKKLALEKHENIINGINKLKESLGDFSYNYFMNGDTHGIYESGLYIEFEVMGYEFRFPVK